MIRLLVHRLRRFGSSATPDYRSLLLALLAMIITAEGIVRAEPAAAQGPQFHSEKPVHDFGEVWFGDNLQHTFVIKNTGNAPLEILNVRPDCGCTLTGAYDKVIEPGEEGKIPVTLNTRTAGRGPVVRRLVRITTNETPEPSRQLTMQATLRHAVQLEPDNHFHWGRIHSEMELTRTARAINQTEEPMKLRLVEGQPASQQFEITIKELEAGKSAEITVTARQPLSHGHHRANFRVATGLSTMPELVVPCSLFQPPPIEIQRALVYVPHTRSGEQEYKIPIRYNDTGRMKILSVEASHPGLETSFREMEGDPGRAFEVTVKVPDDWAIPADQPERIVVKTDVASQPELLIPVRMQPQPRPTVQALPGRPAPDATVRTPEGANRSIGASHTDDKVTVLNFCASWCDACTRQLPMVQRLFALYHRRGVEFLHISTDHARPVDEIVAAGTQLGVSLPIGLDPDATVARQYQATGLPTMIVIGKNGLIEAVHRGAPATPEELHQRAQEIQEQLDTLLAGGNHESFDAASNVAGQFCHLPSLPAPATVQGPAFFTDSPRQAVGVFKPGEEVTYNIHFQNKGAQPLKITRVTPSPAITLKADPPEELAPGASGLVTCAFTAPQNPGPFAHAVQFQTNDAARQNILITLTGTARPFLEVDPAAGVDFGSRSPTHEIPRMASVLFHGEGEINFLSAESSSPKFEAEVQVMGQGPHGLVIVKAKPPFEPGENTATVTVRTDYEAQPTVTIPVRLFHPQRIEVAPSLVEVRPQRRLQRHTVTITNHGETPLHVLGIESSSRHVQTQFYPEADGRSYKLVISLTPEFNSSQDGETVTIRTDDQEYGEIVIPVKVAAAPGPPGSVSHSHRP